MPPRGVRTPIRQSMQRVSPRHAGATVAHHAPLIVETGGGGGGSCAVDGLHARGQQLLVSAATTDPRWTATELGDTATSFAPSCRRPVGARDKDVRPPFAHRNSIERGRARDIGRHAVRCTVLTGPPTLSGRWQLAAMGGGGHTRRSGYSNIEAAAAGRRRSWWCAAAAVAVAASVVQEAAATAVATAVAAVAAATPDGYTPPQPSRMRLWQQWGDRLEAALRRPFARWLPPPAPPTCPAAGTLRLLPSPVPPQVRGTHDPADARPLTLVHQNAREGGDFSSRGS